MLIEAHNLWKVFHRGHEQVEALRGVHLELPEAAFGVIVGPSGGGKSTLLHLLGGMDQPTRGTLSVCGVTLENVSEGTLNRFRRENIGFIFQFYNLIPSLSAVENIALPLLAQRVSRRQALRRASELLTMVGIDHRAGHKPSELSGGEQQRVAVARAIAGRARLVLADEPTGDLDSVSAQTVMDLMVDLNQRLGVTFLVATHNESFSRYASHAFMLRNGQFVSE